MALFGDKTLKETTGEFLFYRAFQLLCQVATGLLLGYGAFAFFIEPLTAAYGEMGYKIAVVVSTLFVIFYEIAKYFSLRRGLYNLVLGLRYEAGFTLKAILPLATGIALCYGSWIGANKGAEHIAREKTDKAPQIQATDTLQKGKIENSYLAEKKELTAAHDKEIEKAQSAYTDYKNSVAYHGHIDTRNKDIVATLKTYATAIETEKNAKTKELDELKSASTGKKEAVAVTTTSQLADNNGKQSFYQECIYYGSVVLEWGVFCFIFLIMWSEYTKYGYQPKPTTTTGTPLPQTPVVPATPVKVAAPVQNPLTARAAIAELNERMRKGTEQNDKAQIAAAQEGLKAYAELGYDISTGDFIGKPQTVVVSPTPPAPVGKPKADNPALKDYKDGLNLRGVLRTRIKNYYLQGEGNLLSFQSQWHKNEDRILVACDALGNIYDNPDVPCEADFLVTA